MSSLHRVQLFTVNRQPLLEGPILTWVEQGLRALPARYPGLRIVKNRVRRDGVDLTLDFQRLDEDLARVVQSFKTEVRNLARKRNLCGDILWQWGYEETEGVEK